MSSLRNGGAQPQRLRHHASKAYRRSPYREPTTAVRIPESLLPRVRKMLDEIRADVSDSAWLNK